MKSLSTAKSLSLGIAISCEITPKTSDDQKDLANREDDAAAPILIFVIACLILAILILRSPETVVLSAEQISLMPLISIDVRVYRRAKLSMPSLAGARRRTTQPV